MCCPNPQGGSKRTAEHAALAGGAVSPVIISPRAAPIEPAKSPLTALAASALGGASTKISASRRRTLIDDQLEKVTGGLKLVQAHPRGGHPILESRPEPRQADC
jgi:hypothetical protein